MGPGTSRPHWESNIFLARRAFKRDELRILLSDRHEVLREHTLGIRESSARSSGDPTSRILSLTEEQVSSHDGMVTDFMI